MNQTRYCKLIPLGYMAPTACYSCLMPDKHCIHGAGYLKTFLASDLRTIMIFMLMGYGLHNMMITSYSTILKSKLAREY